MLTESQLQEIIAGNASRNAELLRVLAEKDVPLDLPRLVEHHFWAHEQRDAALLARDLHDKSYLVTSIARVENNVEVLWSVEAETEQTPEIAGSAELTRELANLAARFDGIYDGWGTRIDRPKSNHGGS